MWIEGELSPALPCKYCNIVIYLCLLSAPSFVLCTYNKLLFFLLSPFNICYGLTLHSAANIQERKCWWYFLSCICCKIWSVGDSWILNFDLINTIKDTYYCRFYIQVSLSQLESLEATYYSCISAGKNKSTESLGCMLPNSFTHNLTLKAIIQDSQWPEDTTCSGMCGEIYSLNPVNYLYYLDQ